MGGVLLLLSSLHILGGYKSKSLITYIHAEHCIEIHYCSIRYYK